MTAPMPNDLREAIARQIASDTGYMDTLHMADNILALLPSPGAPLREALDKFEEAVRQDERYDGLSGTSEALDAARAALATGEKADVIFHQGKEVKIEIRHEVGTPVEAPGEAQAPRTEPVKVKCDFCHGHGGTPSGGGTCPICAGEGWAWYQPPVEAPTAQRAPEAASAEGSNSLAPVEPPPASLPPRGLPIGAVAMVEQILIDEYATSPRFECGNVAEKIVKAMVEPSPSGRDAKRVDEPGACGICHHEAAIPGDICGDCYRKLMNEKPETERSDVPKPSSAEGSKSSHITSELPEGSEREGKGVSRG